MGGKIGGRRRGAREPLNRERVLAAAVVLADEIGFDALTMRGLAERLGVQAMSLYNHVADKADLRDGIVDLVLREVEVPTPGDDWRAQLRRSAISLYETFRRHPWSSRQMMLTGQVSPARLRWMEGVLATLRQAGCSAALAHHFYHALDAHTTGFSLWLANFPFENQEDLAARARAMLAEVDTYPYLVEHIQQHLSPPPGEPSEFEFGLDLILDGVQRLRDEAKPTRRQGRRPVSQARTAVSSAPNAGGGAT